MKKLVICFTFSLFGVSFLIGQTLDFAPVGAKWYFTEPGFFPPPFSETPHVVEVESKELYQGNLCSKLIGVGSETVPDPLYVYSQNDSVFYYSLFSGQFELLYDFGAEIGESWTINGLGTPNQYDSMTVQVDSINYMIVSGLPLKVLHLNLFGNYDWGKQIIEGIGNTFFLTPDYGLYEYGPGGLRCYSVGDTLLQFVPYPCDTTFIITSTEEVPIKTNIVVTPNPATEVLYIHLSGTEAQGHFRLVDILGLTVREFAASPGDTTYILPLEGVPAGWYLLQYEEEGRRLSTGLSITTH